MEYLTAKEVAGLWDVTQRRVTIYCSEGRIDGAQLKGKMWLIPRDAQKPGDARSTRFQPHTPAAVKPFLKWAGGKAQILDNIKMKYPSELGKSVTKYAEPFVGGGAVLFDILSNYDMEKIYIGDINRELVFTYQTVKDEIDELIPLLKKRESEYLQADDATRKEIYYRNRTKFNELKLAQDEMPELAALFIYLNRTCFNGLYRVNSKGEFNVPQGSYKNPCICDEDNLRAVSKSLKKVQIVCGDFRLSERFIDSNTFAYFDPPYRPLSASASFTAYAQGGFGDEEQIELARFIDKLSAKGVYVIASNSDPKNTDENDDFFDALYAKHKIFRIHASRAINSVGNGRGKVSELLIANR